MGRKFNLFIIKLTSSQLVFWAYKDKEKPPCLWGGLVLWAGLAYRNPPVQLAPPYVASSLGVLLVAQHGLCISYSPPS